MSEKSVSSISIDWSIQSISIKSDLSIFIDLSIDKSIPILSIDYSGLVTIVSSIMILLIFIMLQL